MEECVRGDQRLADWHAEILLLWLFPHAGVLPFVVLLVHVEFDAVLLRLLPVGVEMIAVPLVPVDVASVISQVLVCFPNVGSRDGVAALLLQQQVVHGDELQWSAHSPTRTNFPCALVLQM